MAITHDVSLLISVIGAQTIACDVWDEYSITLSMLQPGSPFTFTLWRSQTRQTTWEVLTDRITGVHVGDLVTLAIDGDVVLTGWIETRVQAADPQRGAYLTISGRDMAGPAMEAHCDPHLALRGMALDAALTAVFSTIGLTVTISATVNPSATVSPLRVHSLTRTGRVSRSARLDLTHPRVGETVWEVANRICRRMGYLIWVAPASGSDVTTGLVVDTPNYSGPRLWTLRRADGAATTNVLEAQERVSLHGVPTSVTDYGDAIRGDSASARLSHTLPNTVLSDVVLTNDRISPTLLAQLPRYIKSNHARSVRDAQGEAARMLAEANAHLRVWEGTVQGHSTAQGGPIFRPNAMVTIDDEVTGVDEDMLVTDVHFERDHQGGTRTKLTAIPINSMVLIPVTS